MQSAEHYRKIYQKKIDQDVSEYLTPERAKKIHERLEKAAGEGRTECFVDFQHGLNDSLAAGLQEYWAETFGLCATMVNGGVLFDWGDNDADDDACALDDDDD